MNIQALLDQAKSQKSSNNKRMFAQQEILRGVSGSLEKHEQKPNTWFNFVIPKQLQLPFNPVDVTDDFFNAENPYIVKGLVDETVIELKKAMRTDPELHKLYATLGGLTVEEYDISKDEYTKQDFNIFNEHCYPYQPSLPTIKFTTKSAGQFGTTRLSPLEFNSDGECTTPNLLVWQLRQYEQAIVDQVVAEYLLDKDKSALDDDQKRTLAAKKTGHKMGVQKRTAYLIYLEFPMDEKTESVTSDALKAKLEDCLRYMKFNGDEMKKVLKKRGKKKDVYNNFWDCQVMYGDGKPNGDEKPEIALYKSREYELIQPARGADVDDDDKLSIFDKKPEMIKEVNEYISANVEHNFEALAKKYIWDFHPISDAALLEHWSDRFQETAKYVSKKIYNKYIGIIEKSNIDVAKELHELNKQNKLCLDFTSEVQQAQITGNVVEVIEGGAAGIPDEVEEDEEFEGSDLGDLVGVDDDDLVCLVE